MFNELGTNQLLDFLYFRVDGPRMDPGAWPVIFPIYGQNKVLLLIDLDEIANCYYIFFVLFLGDFCYIIKKWIKSNAIKMALK